MRFPPLLEARRRKRAATPLQSKPRRSRNLVPPQGPWTASAALTSRAGMDLPGSPSVWALMLKARLKPSSKHASPKQDGCPEHHWTCQNPSGTRSLTECFASLLRQPLTGRQQAPLPLGMRNPLQRMVQLPSPARTSQSPRQAVRLPASASSGPVEAPSAGVAVKKEDEGARKPLLSDDCCTCYACNISVPYKKHIAER